MAKNKLITHTDLDGVACAVLYKAIYPDANIQYTTPSYINNTISKWLDDETYKYFDEVIITDLSVNKENADRIDKLVTEGKLNLQLLDHHESDIELAKRYQWYNELVESNGYLFSGASLLYYYLDATLTQAFKKNILTTYQDFIENTRLYDTWEWIKDKTNRAPGQLNDLLWITGRNKFIERFLSKPNIYPLTEAENALLIQYETDQTDYANKALKHTTFDYQFGKYKVAITYADRFINEVGMTILDSDEFKGSSSEAVVMIHYPNTLSIRSNNGLAAEVIAESFDGGGHTDSAGIPLKGNSKVIPIILDYYNKVLTKEL